MYGAGWKEAKDGLGDLLVRHPDLIPDNAPVEQMAERLVVLARAVEQQNAERNTPAIASPGRPQ